MGKIIFFITILTLVGIKHTWRIIVRFNDCFEGADHDEYHNQGKKNRNHSVNLCLTKILRSSR